MIPSPRSSARAADLVPETKIRGKGVEVLSASRPTPQSRIKECRGPARESGHDGWKAHLTADSRLAQRIDKRQQFESTKAAVEGTDAADSVLPHQNGPMQVVHHVAAKVGQFRECLRKDG